MLKKIIVLLLIIAPLAGTSQSARKTNKLLKKEYALKLETYDSLFRLHESVLPELFQLAAANDETINAYINVVQEATDVKVKTIALFQKSTLLGLDKSVSFTVQSVETLNIPDGRAVLEELSEKYEKIEIISAQSFDLNLDELKVREQNELLSKTILLVNREIETFILFNQKVAHFVPQFKEDCAWLKREAEKWRIEKAALVLKQHELEQVLQSAKDNYAKNGPMGFSEQYGNVFPDVFPKEAPVKKDWSNLDFEEADGFEEVLIPSPLPPPPPPVSDNIVHTFVEESPEFPGGMIALKAFIDANLNIPEVAIEQRIEGKCYLQFIVSKTGNISNVQVMRGVAYCPECDQEAIRMVKSMPNWKPGKNGGKPVNSVFNLPVAFKLPQ